MMTIPQVRAIVGQQIGLSASFDGSMTAYGNLTPAQQIALTKGVFDYIRAHPSDFTEAQVQTVNTEGNRVAALTIEDSSFDYGAFLSALEDNAISTIGDPLARIGNGISASVSLIGTLLPVGVVVAVVIFALPYWKKANA